MNANHQLHLAASPRLYQTQEKENEFILGYCDKAW